jgi:hypothetical protein
MLLTTDLQSMCVSAVVQTNSTVQYTLTVKQSQVGWMAVLVSIINTFICSLTRPRQRLWLTDD